MDTVPLTAEQKIHVADDVNFKSTNRVYKFVPVSCCGRVSMSLLGTLLADIV